MEAFVERSGQYRSYINESVFW